MKKFLLFILLSVTFLACSKKDDVVPVTTTTQTQPSAEAERRTPDVSKILQKGFWTTDSYVFTDVCPNVPFVTDTCVLKSKLYFLAPNSLKEYYGCDNTILLDQGTWEVRNNNSVIFLNTINFPNYTFNIVSLENKRLVVTYTFAGRPAKSVLTQHN